MQRFYFLKLFFIAACYMATLIFWSPDEVWADEANEEPMLQRLIVTGKRSESFKQNMPGNISVINEDETFIHPVDALAVVPGVMMHRGSGVEHLTSIRSPVLVGGAGAGSFLFMENGSA